MRDSFAPVPAKQGIAVRLESVIASIFSACTREAGYNVASLRSIMSLRVFCHTRDWGCTGQDQNKKSWRSALNPSSRASVARRSALNPSSRASIARRSACNQLRESIQGIENIVGRNWKQCTKNYAENLAYFQSAITLRLPMSAD